MALTTTNSWAIVTGGTLIDDGGYGLPEGAFAYANFDNGTYSYGGNAFSDFITENGDWGSFDPNVSAVPGIGLHGIILNPKPAIAPTLAAAMLADGFTLVFTVFVEDGTSWNIDIFDSPAFNTDLQFNFDSAGGGQTGIFDDDNTLYPDAPAPGMHKVAITYNAGHLAMCIDGGAVISHDMASTPAVDSIGLKLPTIATEIVAYPAKADGEIAALCTFDPNDAPEFTVDPTISGTPQVGQMLTCSAGTATGATSTGFYWFSAETQLATGATYTPQPGDVGAPLLCAVIAENADGYAYKAAISDTITG